jgi:peptide chain release factor 2
MQRLTGIKDELETWRGLDNQARSLEELISLTLAEKDESLAGSLADETIKLAEKLDESELKLALSGKYDDCNAIIAFHAGAGGVEAQDWVRMLMRMYIRWAERRGYKADVLDVSPGDEGGVKSATIQVSGGNAYGFLRVERGVHRLVRLSPFDADHARHTTFALMEVLPEVEEGVDVSVNPEDLKIEVFRSAGAGGQNVQKTSTAVRITHLPTGIRVACQNERSQHQNKTIAMRVLLARLAEREMEARSKEMAELKGEHVSGEWGNQIRSYVLHPYRLVKDHRTGHETSDADGVLDGDINGFIRAYLVSTVGKSAPIGSR